jgi:hypothetical protein
MKVGEIWRWKVHPEATVRIVAIFDDYADEDVLEEFGKKTWIAIDPEPYEEDPMLGWADQEHSEFIRDFEKVYDE